MSVLQRFTCQIIQISFLRYQSDRYRYISAIETHSAGRHLVVGNVGIDTHSTCAPPTPWKPTRKYTRDVRALAWSSPPLHSGELVYARPAVLRRIYVIRCATSIRTTDPFSELTLESGRSLRKISYTSSLFMTEYRVGRMKINVLTSII